MHPFFEPLSPRETMLLLTTLTVGEPNDAAIFDLLGAESSQRLKEKAEALKNIPSDKRVALMVRVIKEALATNGFRGAERADPTWIIQALKGENARTVATVLVSLPQTTVRSVLKRLPDGIKAALPAKEQMQTVAPHLLTNIRQVFESRFSKMPDMPASTFAFRDIIHLERSEIFVLMRDLGLVELGQAFASMGKMALAELCRRLPRDKSEELIEAVRTASRVNLPDRKTAQRFLSRVVVNFEDTEEFFQKAGLWRIAKASLNEGEGFRKALQQRIPIGAAQVFADYLDKALEMRAEWPEDLPRVLQDTILVRIRLLSKRGILGPRWNQVELQLHDPQAAAAFIEGPDSQEPANANAPSESEG